MTEAATNSTAGGSVLSAMWLWSVTEAEAREVATFVKRRQVRTVFLGVGWNGPELHVVALAAWLRTKNVAVHCLGADQGWLAEPDLAMQWLGRARRAWAFDAVHLDVEPWVLDGWEDGHDRARILEQYVTLLRMIREAGLPLEVDVAPRLAVDLVGTKRALDAVLGTADRVTVMAYRDHAEGANGILDLSQAARTVCSEHQVDFRIGVETQPAAKAGGPGNTFAEEGRAVLDREAAIVSGHLAVDPHYLGVAVHDWQHWSRLP